MSKNITIYTSNTCSQCKMVKQVLTMKGFSYDELNIDDDPAHQTKVLQLTGQHRVPVTVVQDDESGFKRVVTGYNLSQLMPALN